MKIGKLELKHLCGYLPHKLNAILESRGKVLIKGIQDDNDIIHSLGKSPVKFIKPLLLPLSALTEPLEDGTVPIVELAKMANFLRNKDQNFIVNTDRFSFGCSSKRYEFWYCDEGSFFASRINYNENNEFVSEVSLQILNQLQLFEYLYSKHFDIYGLIDSGLAIDKRTVKL